MARRRPSSRRRTPKKKKTVLRTAKARGTAIARSLGLSIEDDRLVGGNVSFVETPNKGGDLAPRYLVFHYTAGKSATSSINWLTNPESKASAHLVLARDGTITQLAPFNIKTWHAGLSHWNGLSGLNSYSIGIEMDNAGPLKKVGDQYQPWFGTLYAEDRVVLAKHKLDDEPRWWHAYTEIQIQRALELAQLLVRHYQLQDVVGHEDIAPDRKRDPGPAFPLEHVRAVVLGREEEEREGYEVMASTLNIRSGPGVEFPSVAEPLKRGTVVVLLEKRDRWHKVELVKNGDIEGWVHNRFLAKA
ncbi:MAG: N-acetylmuramoyl-L-alanine amidase [Nitrospiraceae bacterium]|nr:N-acetylmuramoyl-L-alanine amidase [Nitrospiraceae bacterium]